LIGRRRLDNQLSVCSISALRSSAFVANKKHHASSEESARDAGIRSLRIEELIREELNSLLDSEVTDPCLEGARITMVELSRDGSRARIWFGIAIDRATSSAQETQAAFTRASSFFRGRLCEALALKRMPELRFRYDPAAVVNPSAPEG
jgi:ribosome-binding factor A